MLEHGRVKALSQHSCPFYIYMDEMGQLCSKDKLGNRQPAAMDIPGEAKDGRLI